MREAKREREREREKGGEPESLSYRARYKASLSLPKGG